MFRNIALTLSVTLWGLSSLLVPSEALAQTPLSRAVLQSLKNRVQLIPKSQQARPARVSDAMSPGDALATAKASAAQLRFNDGSLARLGEQAAFKFVPGTRTFQLSNGTALVLIPPGRGTTNVRTPNAAAGIRGSALFVRYNPETETTLVGALTDSGIQVFNKDGSQRQELKPGYMAVIVKDRIVRVYEFDLKTFYQTSDLVRGLDLNQTAPADNSDEAIASVRSETVQALKAQQPITGENVIENPSFVQLSVDTSGDYPRTDTSVVDGNPAFQEPNFSDFGNTTNVRSLLEGGEILDTRTRTDTNNNGAGGNGTPGRGNQGTGNNPDGPGGNGGGNGNPGRGNQGTGNNPDGPGGNGGGNGNSGRGNQGTGNNPDGPGGNGGGNGNSGRGNQGTGNNPDGPGGNGGGNGNSDRDD